MDLRERYQSLDESALDRFVDQGQEENLYLEFKTLDDSSFSTRPPRKTFARMVSGFANAQGGIIVWGIRADSGDRQDEPDVAREKVPVEDFENLLPRLNGLTAEATAPIQDSVEHRAIAVDGNEGYAATLVPETSSAPGMAKLGVDRYFKRSGDSFLRMEHYEIADMFGRRARPDLRLVADRIRVNLRQGGTKLRFQLSLGLRNNGRGIARAPYIGVTPPDGWGGSASERALERKLQPARGHRYEKVGGADRIIHPGTTLIVLNLRWNSVWREKLPEDFPDPIFHYETASMNTPLTAGTLEIPVEDFRQAMQESPNL